MKPKTLILRTAGTNCDAETAHAFELAGASAERVHLNRVLESPAMLDGFQLLAIPGGFSYGDDIAAGRILANQIVHHLRDPLRRFIEAGKPVIGICNGFQVLIKTDLLPGPLPSLLPSLPHGPLGDAAGKRPGEIGSQNCTLTNNDCGRFIDRWIKLMPKSKKCVWTTGVEPLELPIAHGEGKFVPADESVRRALWDQDQVAFIYSSKTGDAAAGGIFPDNPNGSTDDIAGICDETGLVLGLMPHPERYVSKVQHFAWSRQFSTVAEREGDGSGLKLFRNAVAHASSAVGQSI